MLADEAARYFGAEAECNGRFFDDYSEDIANYYGYGTWAEVPRSERACMISEFNVGADTERERD